MNILRIAARVAAGTQSPLQEGSPATGNPVAQAVSGDMSATKLKVHGKGEDGEEFDVVVDAPPMGDGQSLKEWAEALNFESSVAQGLLDRDSFNEEMDEAGQATRTLGDASKGKASFTDGRYTWELSWST